MRPQFNLSVSLNRPCSQRNCARKHNAPDHRDRRRVDDLHQIDVALNHRTSATVSTQGLDGNWMLAVLVPDERRLVTRLSRHPSVKRFVQIADVDIGIVTGANDFFVVDEQTVDRYELQAIAFPMLAKSDLISGITYTAQDHRLNAEAGKAGLPAPFPRKTAGRITAEDGRIHPDGEESGLAARALNVASATLVRCAVCLGLRSGDA